MKKYIYSNWKFIIFSIIKEKSLYIPLKDLIQILKLYPENYEDSNLRNRILELIK